MVFYMTLCPTSLVFYITLYPTSLVFCPTLNPTSLVFYTTLYSATKSAADCIAHLDIYISASDLSPDLLKLFNMTTKTRLMKAVQWSSERKSVVLTKLHCWPVNTRCHTALTSYGPAIVNCITYQVRARQS